MDKLPADKSLILFDGYCTLCSRLVQLILKYDRRKHFLFCALTSDTGQKIRQHLAIPEDIDSILLVENGQYYTHSEAVLKIAKQLGGFFRIGLIGRIMPKSWRDQLYCWIAKNRFHWFGRRNSCRMPLPEETDRFL
ncbi:DCC1-like thiol-disulfide oxidoreductase family protein [uncultured Sunxiuqinia sp.]|uniref:thiol-disulfide oxidoreductase DCC family protein n=1 Tax=uncultured Sunxiuqinia sp. TaxID=1573825 RepID=UPI00260BB9CD|nr:DCC1-like thiol-disulfide oxidoreductase family protein [uncultured Sunxiuqinia sp.]